MADDVKVVLPFGGEDRTFGLTIGPLRALQRICDAGPAEIRNRLLMGTYRLDDVRETIRQGLMGGGATDAESTKLVKLHIDDRPIEQFVLIAHAIVGACLVGVPDDPVGEGNAEEGTTSPTSPAARSGSQGSTAPAAPSASPPATSTSSPSGSSTPALKAGKPRTAANPRSKPRRTKSTPP